MLYSGCGRQVVSTAGINGEGGIKNGFVNDLSDEAKDGRYQANAEELAALSQMKILLSNEYLDLYVGKYYDIAIKDKSTGSITFSNKAIYDATVNTKLNPTGKAECYSSVTLTYYDNANKSYTLSSYPDCVNGSNKDSVTVQNDANSATITYAFGTKNMDDVICTAFLVKDFEDLEEKAQQKIADGTINRVDFARFKAAYTKVILENLSEAEKLNYLNEYPSLKEWGELYILKNPTDIIKAIVSKVSPVLGIDSKYIQEEMDKIGLEANNVKNNSAYFEIPLTYQLDGRDLLVSVDTAKIVNGEGFYLTRLNLLNQFGAALSQQDGYVFVPEGSGAVVENTTTTTDQSFLDIPFYGTDFCVDTTSSDKVTPYASFPVFGVKADDKAYFAIVESSDAIGGVTAQVPDGVTPYNTAKPWLTYYIQEVNSDENFVYSRQTPDTVYTLRYHLLYGKEASYSGMARYYQTYLLQTGLLKKRETAQSMPLNLDFVCAINKKQFVWGMPVDALATASTLAEIQNFAEVLEKDGIQDIDYILQGAINGGMNYQIPSTVHIEKIVGGKKAYVALNTYLKSIGNGLYQTIDFSKVYKKGNNLSQNLQISRYINRKVAFVSDYDPSLQTKNSERSAFLINPQAYSVILESFIQENAAYENNRVCVSSIGSYLSSNFNEKSYVSRQQSENLSCNALKMLKDNQYQVMVDGCNAYTLSYADKLVNIPITSGNYTIESYAVPFVGMVLHGYIPYSGPTLNNQGNYDVSLLQNIESGAGLHYLLMTGDPLMFSDTQYSDMYNVSAAHWQEDIIGTYQKLNRLCGELSACTITEHSRIADGVFKTVYSNGVSIAVNYNGESFTTEGVEIQPMSYGVLAQ